MTKGWIMPGAAEPTFATFHTDLINALPEAEPIVREHLDEMGGEALPYIFFPGFVRQVAAAFASGDSEFVTRALTSFAQWHQSADESVRGLVAVEVCEAVALDPQRFPDGFEETLPASLAAPMLAIRRWHQENA